MGTICTSGAAVFKAGAGVSSAMGEAGYTYAILQAENFVSSIKDGFKDTKDATKRMAADTPETQRLAERYGTPVQIRRTAKGGRVEIAFTSDDQLAKLLDDLAR